MAVAATLRPFDPVADLGWAEELLEMELAGRLQARGGELMDPLATDAAGRVAELGGARVGLVTWVVGGPGSGQREAEVRVLVVTEDARNRGIGGRLLAEAVLALAGDGIERAWLVTTNDNLDALRFYQRRGWRLAALHAGAVDETRRTLKPAIALEAANGVPIRDELVLEVRPGAAG